jgi:hypothetical protein
MAGQKWGYLSNRPLIPVVSSQLLAISGFFIDQQMDAHPLDSIPECSNALQLSC